MKQSLWIGLVFVAFFCLISVPSVNAQNEMFSENFTCGNSQLVDIESQDGLFKSTQLPTSTRVRTGKFRALIFRISFSDGLYIIDTTTIGKTNATINTLFASMSRNTFQWDFKIYPTILNAPGSRANYSSNFSSLQSWIAAQISAAGLRRGIDYDVYIASFPSLTLAWAGLSNMREANWINGNYSSVVTAHELGHSLGLPHAHSIEAGPDMIGVPGTDANTNEYGNPYDVMGNGGSTSHFNVLYKLQVGWEDADEIQEIKAPGVYRIYAHDNAAHKSRLIGIRVPSSNPNYAYWFEYRTLSTSARNGASVLFQGFKSPNSPNTWYLDTTPGSRSNSDEIDGVLMPGKQFMDKYGTTTFKTLAINTNTWNENGWVDVQVTMPMTQVIEPKSPSWTKESAWNGINPVIDILGRNLESRSTHRSGELIYFRASNR